MTEIALKLTFDELRQIDKYVELNDETRPLLNKIKDAYPEHHPLFDVIRNLGYSVDCSWEIVDAVEAFQNSKEWKPKPQTPEETEKGLRNAMRTAIKEGIIPEIKQPTDELIDKLVENPPSFLKFELGKTLEDIVNRWWCDTFTGSHENWSMEECIDDLIDQIHLWIPKEQSAAGSQNAYVECSVEGFNDAIKKIKSKLRNKK